MFTTDRTCPSLSLKKFNMSNMQDYCTLAIIGKRRSGKTTLLNDILRKINVGNENIFIFDEFVKYFNTWENIPTDNINNEQKLLENERSEKIIINSNYSNRSNLPLTKFVLQGRHLLTTTIFELQYPTLPPSIRNNIDYSFIFPPNSIEMAQLLHNNYASSTPSFEMFKDIIASLSKYQCIVVDNTQPFTTKLEDRLFYYNVDVNNLNNNVMDTTA